MFASVCLCVCADSSVPSALMTAVCLHAWRGSEAGSSGSPPQVFRAPVTPAEGPRCSTPGVWGIQYRTSGHIHVLSHH